jgi:hypothetical protein
MDQARTEAGRYGRLAAELGREARGEKSKWNLLIDEVIYDRYIDLVNQRKRQCHAENRRKIRGL